VLIPFIFIAVDASSLGGCTATGLGVREDLLAISDFLIFEFSAGRQSGAGFQLGKLDWLESEKTCHRAIDQHD
jgi:hypothetical protein